MLANFDKEGNVPAEFDEEALVEGHDASVVSDKSTTLEMERVKLECSFDAKNELSSLASILSTSSSEPPFVGTVDEEDTNYDKGSIKKKTGADPRSISTNYRNKTGLFETQREDRQFYDYDSYSDLESRGSAHDAFLSPNEDVIASSSTGLMTNKGKRLSAIDENYDHDTRGELGEESGTLRRIMFNSDVLRPFPNKEISRSSREEVFFDAKKEILERDRTIMHGNKAEPNNRVKFVRFVDEEENHLLEWHDPANHHCNNVLRVLPQDPSGVLDIYHEAQDNPFYDFHEGSHKYYSREVFKSIMYDDEDSSCGYDSEEDILKYDERTVWGFLFSLGSMAIHTLVSTVRKSKNDAPANEEMVMGREIIEDTTNVVELAADSAFNTGSGATSALNSLNSAGLSSTSATTTATSSTVTSSTGAATTAVMTTASSTGVTSATASSAGATTTIASTAGAAAAMASSAGAATTVATK